MARIYTRTGDKGDTGLVGGTRVSKDSLRVKAYGEVDELNSVLGLTRSFLADPNIDSILENLQKDLFVAGADLATPYDAVSKIPRISHQKVAELEAIIDRFQNQLQPLKAFILPGGGQAGACLHFARSVARRAERGIVTLSKAERIGDQMIPFINRVADLLFVLARAVNSVDEKPEAEWHSGC